MKAESMERDTSISNINNVLVRKYQRIYYKMHMLHKHYAYT